METKLKKFFETKFPGRIVKRIVPYKDGYLIVAPLGNDNMSNPFYYADMKEGHFKILDPVSNIESIMSALVGR